MKRHTTVVIAKTIGVMVAAIFVMGQDGCRLVGPECPLALPVYSADASPADSVSILCPYRIVDENGDTTTVNGTGL